MDSWFNKTGIHYSAMITTASISESKHTYDSHESKHSTNRKFPAFVVEAAVLWCRDHKETATQYSLAT